MALSRPEAWVTYAIRPDHVPMALVLAQSIRNTGTKRRIAAIASASLSSEETAALLQGFDALHYFNHLKKPVDGSQEKATSAKIFAFSLDTYSKCFLLEPSSIFLENMDDAFELAQNLHYRQEGISPTWDNFLMVPSIPVYHDMVQHFEKLEKVGNGRLREFADKWMGINPIDPLELGGTSSPKMAYLENSIGQLCLETGQLLERKTWTPPSIVQFVNGPVDFENFVKRLKNLSNPETGITEQAIFGLWLKLSHEIRQAVPSPNLLTAPNEPIAIIGLSCRLPGANNLDEFWKLLYSGGSAIRPPPSFRWRNEHVMTAVGENERRTQAGFLTCPVDEFDGKFFGVSPKEALFLDPQTRLMHEVLWESLESAGLDPSGLQGTHAGIFTGSWLNDYRDIVQSSATRDFFRTYMGTGIGAGAARLSFLLGVTGPCLATESGCSSAMVAVDRAVKSLRCGETHLALAGGVNLLLHPFTSDMMEFVIAPDGRCKAFDANADGFGRAEGCGFLVLKRGSDAIRDRDHVWALIRGSAVSQEGVSRSLGTPTVHSEALAMRLALENAGVSPAEVSHVECHATATKLGDPVEVAALAQAYHSPNRKTPLVIGSVKTNVGHTESCSGITGIIKAVLSMKNELIPRHLNLEKVNPHINLDAIPAQIPLEAVPWPRIPGQPRLAGVSSFGITGTDAHVVLEEPKSPPPKYTVGLERPLQLMKISGKTKVALDKLLEKYRQMLESGQISDAAWVDVTHTANVGRANFEHRAFLVAGDMPSALDILAGGQVTRGEVKEEEASSICFLFTGQGSQYLGMGKTLYESSPVFRFHFDECDTYLRKEFGLDIKAILWNGESKEISRTIYSQTGIFVVEYCLLKLWESWGVKASYALGHSLGEFCAAVAAGLLTLEQALKLVAERSRLIDALPVGSMLAVKANEVKVKEIMKTQNIQLDIAAVNSEEQTVVAGDSGRIQDFLEACQAEGVKGVILEATHAFHSRHNDPILQIYGEFARKMEFGKKDGCQFISGMEGGMRDTVDVDYWVRHTRDKVNFLEASKTVRNLGVKTFIEVGPHPVLSAFVMSNRDPVICLPSLRRGTQDWETILNSLGKLWISGYQVNWQSFDKPYSRNKVDVLPFYPFERKSVWLDCGENVSVSLHPLVGASLKNASHVSIFQKDLNPDTLPYLKDHRIGHRIVFPGAAFTEMCMVAGYAAANLLKNKLEKPSGGMAMAIENLKILAPLELVEEKSTRLQVLVHLPDQAKSEPNSETAPGFKCRVFRKTRFADGESDKWVPHVTADFYPITKGLCLETCNTTRVSEMINGSCIGDMKDFYKEVNLIGLQFGGSFRSIEKCWKVSNDNWNVNEVVSQIRTPSQVDQYLLHPVVLDAMFQTQVLARLRNIKAKTLQVPVQVRKLTLCKTLDESHTGRVLYIHATWKSKDECVVFLYTEDFQPVAQLEGVELLETTPKTIQSVLDSQQSSPLPDCWKEMWKPILYDPNQQRVTMGNILQPIASCSELSAKFTKIGIDLKVPKREIKDMDRLVTLFAYRALLQIGWQPTAGTTLSAASLCGELGIQRGHLEQQLRFFFTSFEEELGLMKRTKGAKWRITKVLYPTLEKVDAQLAPVLERVLKSERTETVGKVYAQVGRNLPQLLKGELSALSLLFPGESQQELGAERYYLQYPGRQEGIQKIELTFSAVSKKIRAASSQQAVARVIEVGAGTGSLSVEALRILKAHWGTNFEYYYTDISSSFFVKAEERFDEYCGQIKFAVFNIEENPLTQGIPVNYFDWILATEVLHATRDLRESLAHLRLVLRPGGMLTFTETVTVEKGLTSVFGLLQGYWRFQDKDVRPYHACVSPPVWKDLLLQSGFDHVHVISFYWDKNCLISAEANPMTGYDQWAHLQVSQCGQQVENRRWIIFAPEERQDKSLMSKIAQIFRGTKCRVDFVRYNPEEIDTLISQLVLTNEPSQSITGVIYAWGMTTASGVISQHQIGRPLLHLVQKLLTLESPPRLYVITKDVQAAITEEINNIWPATLWGMVKTLKNENVQLFVRCVDLNSSDVQNLDTAVNQLLYELALYKESRDKERVQVAYREGKRLEPRFSRVRLASPALCDMRLPPSTDRYRLALPSTKLISDLEFKPLLLEPLSQDEMEVEVHAYALNFRDIFAILKPTPEFQRVNTVGMDFSGVVCRLPTGETKWKLGDRVYGINIKETQFFSHLVVGQETVLPISSQMNFNEACTIPTVYATSIHCLLAVAQLKKGETVLIHTGSGGVGYSAIQVAKHVGATIITTAGSKRKRTYLRKQLGLQHVFHSRNTSFEQEVMKATNSRGVDVVLNSLTGPGFKEATLRCCAKGARFVEMSKLSVWTEKVVHENRADVQYFIADLSSMDRDEWSQLMKQVSKLLETAKFPSIPYVKFDALRLRLAFQHFQKAKHIGKVVVTMPQVQVTEGQWRSTVRLFDSDSTYLITGGLGGIGLAVCKWMLGKGATDVVLTGRSLPTTDVQTEIDALNQRANINVQVIQADVGNVIECAELISEIRDSGRFKPLRGIHHCAGTLRDNLFSKQSWPAFEATFNAKVNGSWNLHLETLSLPLDHFVFYSSSACLLGTPGQVNHAAANNFEDAIAHYRHAIGLPATTINWGQWAEVGVAKGVHVPAVQPVSSERMLNGLKEALRSQQVQLAFVEFESLKHLTMVIPILKYLLDDQLLRSLANDNGIEKEGQVILQSEQFWADIDKAEGLDGKTEVISGYIKAILRKGLRIDPAETIKDDANLQDMGVDSLVFIELRNLIQSVLGSRLTIKTELFQDCRTTRQLTSLIVNQIMDPTGENTCIGVFRGGLLGLKPQAGPEPK